MKYIQQFQHFQQANEVSDSTVLTIERILAIDPGYGRCGWAILEKVESRKWKVKNCDIKLIACDLIETNKQHNIFDRLKEIYDAVDYVIKKYQPTEMAIESLFWFKNQKTAMAVAEARGAIIAAAKNHHLTISEYTPLQVKQAVVGYGKATKMQIQKMISLHLPKQHVAKQDDTADAIAIGLTHIQTKKYS